MTRDDWERLGLHFPWGMLAGWPLFWPVFWPNWGCLILGATAATLSLFIITGYEAFNDWRKGDHSYKDVLGIAWGFLFMVTLVGVTLSLGGLK